jgi:hypothetical protein
MKMNHWNHYSKEERDAILTILKNNLISINVSEVCRACGIQRMRMQRCIIKGGFTDGEIQAIHFYLWDLGNKLKSMPIIPPQMLPDLLESTQVTLHIHNT